MPPATTCPICGKPPQDKTKPFCSPRCANIDLGRWLGEGYAIPAEESASLPNPDDDEERG